METEPIALFYNSGEAQDLSKVSFDLTLSEFKENADKYDMIKVSAYSNVLDERIESDCWNINGVAVYRILFSDGSTTCPFEYLKNKSISNEPEWLENVKQLIK